MNIIITRPREDAEKLAVQISARGHNPIIMPLIEIVPRINVVLPHGQWQALCMTSANGISAVPDDFDRDVPVLCVGPHSAAAATEKGFHNVSFHGGDVDGLVDYISLSLTPKSGAILYVSGAITSGDLAGKLNQLGYSVTRVVAYDAVPLIPPNLDAAMQTADAVLLYSQRTAQLWQSAINSVNLVEKAADITTLCLSKLVASRLPQSWNKRVAETPDEAAILRLIDSLT